MSVAQQPSSAPARPRARLGKKEKRQLRQDVQPVGLQQTSLDAKSLSSASAPLEWFPLQEQHQSNCPVVFSPDSTYSFISSGSAIKIYSTASAELLSTLSPLAFESPASPSLKHPSRKVSAVLLNPSNPLQLIVSSLDGTVRLWDYTEGKLLRTLDMGAPVIHATGHSSLPDQLFVALGAVAEKATSNTGKGSKKPLSPPSYDNAPLAGVYSVSLRASTTSTGSAFTPRAPSRRMRLAHPRPVASLSVSPNGAFLVSLNPQSINVCRTAQLQRGFELKLDAVDEVEMRTMAFHPMEDYLATGDAKGRIRFWYGALDTAEVAEAAALVSNAEHRPAQATAVFHWHANPVASLAFTPNGAYLLSGGQEAVMVLWQLHTGHQEYVPRLGAPIVAMSVTTTETGSMEQTVAVRLQDGTCVMVGSQKLKVSRTISGLKADPPRSTVTTKRSSDKPQIPLALLPTSTSSAPTLVLPSSHPSSLQFYSPSLDSQLLELEISPSNRVSSASEPTRVELVAFSTPEVKVGEKAGEGKGYWMATVDSWKSAGYSGMQRLKFWQRKGDGSSFTLTTRIDSPHSAAITSLSFSPSPTSPLLLTTSLDGRIKLWSLSSSAGSSPSWECRTSLSYRQFLPLSASWSLDGSMFAVAHSRSVTLWSTQGLGLIHAFPSKGIAPVGKVEFVGEEGTALMAGGEHGVVAWDLLTFEETYNMSFEVGSLAGKPSSSTLIATEKPTVSTTVSSSAPSSSAESDPSSSASTAFIIHAPVASTSSSTLSLADCQPRQLPFPVAQSLWLPSPTSDSKETDDQLSLAVVSASTGEISLLGSAARVGSTVLPSRLPSTTSGKGQSRLFDEIFGSSEDASRVRRVEAVQEKGKSKLGEGLEVLEMSAHSLPPVRKLWRSMLGGFKVAQAPSASVDEGALVSEGERMDVEQPAAVEEKARDEEHFAPSQQEELASIFRERLVMSSPSKSPHKQLAGTPKSGQKGGNM